MDDPPDTARGGLLRAEYMTQMTEAEAVALRAPYLRHERRLRLIGWALYLGWPALVVGGFFIFGAWINAGLFVESGFSRPASLSKLGPLLLRGAAFLALGVASCAAASGLRNLDAGQRRLTEVALILWMMSSWMLSGLMWSGWVMSGWVSLPLSLWAYYTVTCPASDVVFSPEYKEARLLTPHLNRESATTGVFLFVLVVVAPLALLCSRC